MAPLERRRVPAHGRAAGRLLQPPALLRAGAARRLGQVTLRRRVVHLVPHSHWDREWYLPFQSFRLRLVDLIDRVLAMLEADERFVFTLDGQLATVDDYLEVRPEAEERIRALVEAGRLAIGPWQTLMDEFLVSGETIVRNLETGRRRGEKLGGPMRLGYLPDMFGHVAQMPQILRRAGIEQAVVWRGVPAAIDRHRFEWAAPDGSSVLAEYLPAGYGNAAYLLLAPDRLEAAVETLVETMEPFFGDDPVLAMYGTDHTEPVPELVELVEEMNRRGASFTLSLQTLDRAVSVPGTADAPAWTGELRSGARASLLPGVVSARIDVKQAAARAERALERYAEPLQALYGGEWPERLLELAWRRVLENSAHDSICGCSVDEVSRQVLVRYAEAEQIADGLARRAAARVAERVPRGSIAVINPSPHERADLVAVDVPIPADWPAVALELADGTRLATQEVARTEPLLLAREVTGSEIPEFLERRSHGRELFGRWLNSFTVDRDGGRRRLTFHVGDEPDPEWLDVDELEREIELAARTAPDERWTVRIVAEPRRTLLTLVPAQPLGWTAARPVSGAAEAPEPVRVEGRKLGNGLIEAEIAPDGTLRIGPLEGVARLVDGGDAGDSYNYAPPAADLLVHEPEAVTVETRGEGPLRGEVAVRRTYRWPLGLLEDASGRSVETAFVPVTTHVELRAAEPFVRLRIGFENPCADHRLRLHVPLQRRADGSAAEGQFAVVERGLEVEGGYGEFPVPTFPAAGFVDAGGVAVLLDHVLEYEVVEGRELALTLLRSTGLISRSAHAWREEPAGPEIAIPEGQCRGPWSVGLAVFPHVGNWDEARVLAKTEGYRHPFVTAAGSGDELGRPVRGLAVDGDGVVLTSLRRLGDELELRIVNEQPRTATAVVSGDSVGALTLELGPWEIRTVRVAVG